MNNTTHSANLLTEAYSIPDKPGCYMFLNAEKKILYVGKARNLKKRVNQYFHRVHNYRLSKMMLEAKSIDFVVTNTEVEALLLEINLIKRHQPEYNFVWMDSKRYPYILVTNEEFPRIITTRIFDKKLGRFYGPLPDGYKAKEVIRLLNRLLPFRKCDKLPKQDCLYHHIGQCLAPCINKNITKLDYLNYKKVVDNFFRGNIDEIVKKMDHDMAMFSEDLNFEKAQEVLDLKRSVIDITARQNIEFIDKSNIDMFGIYVKNEHMVIVVFFYRAGVFVVKDYYILNLINEDYETFQQFLVQFYANNISSDEIIFDQAYYDQNTINELQINYHSPKSGRKKELLELVNRNAYETYEKNVLVALQKIENQHDILTELSNVIGLNIILNKIDLVDTSHIYAESYVGAVVRFTNGKKDFKMFRRYNLDEINTPDDPAAMVLTLKKYFKTCKDLPELIIIDGGKPQIKAIADYFYSNNIQIPFIGLVKDEKHKTDAVIKNNFEKINLDKKSNLFLFLAKMQDEVHNFAISSFRKSYTKNFFSNELNKIPGIGVKTYEKLINEFKTIDNVKKASKNELLRIVSSKLAEIIYKTFHEGKK